MRKALALIAVACALVLLAACGGETNPATGVTHEEATLHASLRCDRGERGAYWAEHRRLGTSAWTRVGRQRFDCGAGVSSRNETFHVSGLQASTGYEFRVCGDLTNPNYAVLCGDSTGAAHVPGDTAGRAYDSFTTQPSPPPPGTDPVIAGAGDIADRDLDAEKTAEVLDQINPHVVFTAGDNAYDNGTLAEYEWYYEPTWGRHKHKTRPTPGNHEYLTSGAAGYFDYFGAAAGERGKGYYAYDLGQWRLYALNSNISMSAGSAQEQWLRQDLGANPRRCALAYYHHPRFSAGHYSDSTASKPLWDALYAHGAELVLNGHDHNYQRYRPMRPDGTADPNGIREIVAGTGGKGHYPLRADGRREAGSDSTFGVLKLTLHPDSYEWRFVPEAGATYGDAGSTSCH